jgi:hypothetical protein
MKSLADRGVRVFQKQGADERCRDRVGNSTPGNRIAYSASILKLQDSATTCENREVREVARGSRSNKCLSKR